VFIQTEETPNPETIKFLPGKQVLPSGTLDFSSASSAIKSPLAQRLFSIVGVNRVFLATDFISVSKDSNTDWSMLKPLILAGLMEHLSMDYPIIDDDFYKDKSLSNDDDDALVTQIKELLEERVRPMVAMDGGDIVFDSFNDGVVYLRMQGACSGCPSSTATLKIGIENMLKHYIPEVTEVQAVADE